MDDPNSPDARRPLHAVVFESSATICKEILEAVSRTGYLIQAVQVTGLGELEEALEAGHRDLLIASYTLSPEQLRQLSGWLEDRTGAPPLILAEYEINADTYAKALRGGARRLLGLRDPECARLVLERETRPQAPPEPACSAPPGAPAGQVVTDAHSCAGSYDLLTGLYSHLYLFDAFDAAVAERPEPDKFNALLHIRLDRFDDTLRQLGEAGSDLVLSEVAHLMRGLITERDTPARIRDETFAILARNHSQEQIRQLATTLRDRVRDNHFVILGQVFKGTCSIGICLFGQEDEHLDEVVSKASLACEVAQGEGDGQIHVFDQTTDAGLRTAMVSGQEQRLRTALAEDRLATVFQPIVNLHASPGDNYEVLVRMTDEHGCQMLPSEFMSAAHQANLLPEIDRWVIRHGIHTLREREDKRTRLFIKLDAQTLADTAFLPWLSQQLRDNGLPGDRLAFQVSEPVIAKQVDTFQWVLQGLHEAHCLCVLEHAGRTANALGLIKSLDVDYIKIDGALAHDLSHSELHQTRVKSLVQRAKADGKRVIVPFVEDAKSLSFLWRWNVDYIQGNYMQRPEAKLNYVFDEQP